MEIFCAGRMVVDTGLHALGWSRQEAVDYMIKHTALAKAELENEIDRYITCPGQAVAYKVGQLKIMELRKRAEEAVGDKYYIRHFHDIYMQSVGPLDLVENEINAWIENGGKRIM
ncbi:hypothetical protein SK128_021925 [Halocaridina rubra]|uniref:DUF885 domain-containing protein n=1 Tax=Halocaridina rubra TaxID=373956 RepID=A0AAN8WRD7_HALRR